MSDIGSVIFIKIPVCVLLTVNLILFRVTSNHYSTIKYELYEFNRTDSKTENFLLQKERFVMSIKLFLIMEFPYLPSIVSFSLERQEINWYIMHVANSLQGVLIFIVFVANHQVITDLRKMFRNSMDHSEPTQIHNISGSS
ncbi:G-protein coupled receptor Mth2 isoform X2 [Acyrthosiphon pisum]|uniref:G-protein coupled receptors family 2 profile 2 domain-containing protein n=1 Tax=Acyrthosiphon pisum TaxID=7029 RepID=A0A8R2H8P2_ACYPI|nr:G-protein coupled receptor Mth2 isoform X2 [Acyrthosiphon pisum]|eukprot:XP_016661251.1 PREDICTED: G-protein coupled receptor Mth2-like isoform X2 [Acyrthosiphon pisum]